MSEQDRYGYDSASHPSHQDKRKRRDEWLLVLIVLLAALAALGSGCVSLPDWGEPSPPLPTTTTTTLPTPEPPPHPCAACLAEGYGLCNQPPAFLTQGCCNQPPGQDCYLIPPATPPPSVPPAPAPPTPTPTPTPTPVPQPGICGAVMPSEPVRVDTGKVEGLVSFPAGTMKVARSSCPPGGLHPNGICFPDEIYQRTGIELAPSESQCFEIGHNLSGAEVVRGMACEGPNPQGDGSYRSGDKQAVQRGCADAYGRRVKEQPFGSGKWVLTAHRDPNGELLSAPVVSWTYFGLCPPLSTQPCMAPPPEPTHDPTPEPAPLPPGAACDVVRIGIEWGNQAGAPDQCPLPGPNQSLDIPAGKQCHLYASASPRAGDGSHVGDRPECFAEVRPFWSQASPQCYSWGPTGECVDLEPHDPIAQGSGTWVRTEDGRGYFAKFDLDFPASGQNWVQACLPTPHGEVCSAKLHLRHR